MEYTIRGIDRDLWLRFKAASALKGISLKEAIIGLIEDSLAAEKRRQVRARQATEKGNA